MAITQDGLPKGIRPGRRLQKALGHLVVRDVGLDCGTVVAIGKRDRRMRIIFPLVACFQADRVDGPCARTIRKLLENRFVEELTLPRVQCQQRSDTSQQLRVVGTFRVQV